MGTTGVPRIRASGFHPMAPALRSLIFSMYADLELSIRRRDKDSFLVEMRYSAPESDTDERPLSGDDGVVRISVADLRALEPNWSAYGAALSDAFFTGAVKSEFLRLRQDCDRAAGLSLRVR